MKKKVLCAVTAFSLAAALFTGCGKQAGEKVIRVGATPTPHAEILEIIKDDLAEKGYTLEIVEYNDYVIPNNATESGELDANYFQHQPYLDDFNAENGTHLVSVVAVHFEPFGIYAGKTKDLADLKEGAIVAVPNDTTNEARALLLLEAQGLITLKEGAGMTATVADIEENPLNLEIKELEAAQTYANIVAVKEGNEESEKIKALVEAILSDEVRDYISSRYEGGVVPVFE